jgi:hypothetical protein
MIRYSTLLLVSGIAIATAPAGCAELASQDDLGSVEQLSFLGDLGVALGSPVTTGSTTGRSNDYVPTCVSTNAPDASYTWTAPSSGTYKFTTAGSSFDTVLEVRVYNTGASLGCNDDSNSTLQSSVSVVLSGGQTVIVVIDGFNTLSGTYQLNITKTSSCAEASCVPVQGDYISHFTGPSCTGTESYYTPYFTGGITGVSGNCQPNLSTGAVCGTVLRTVTNISARINGTCSDFWPSGNTLSGFVTVYR